MAACYHIAKASPDREPAITPCVHVPYVNKHMIKAEYDQLESSGGIVYGSVHLNFHTRLKRYGFSGRVKSDYFTIACALSHRRAWSIFLDNTESDYAFVLEEDAVKRPGVDIEALDQFLREDADWEWVNLGRCWDMCDNDVIVANHSSFSRVWSLNPLCTSAYVISRRGAAKMLRYTLPYVVPIDVLNAALVRSHILNGFSITPPIFLQDRIVMKSHDNTENTECDTDSTTKKMLSNPRYGYGWNSVGDARILNIIKKSPIAQWFAPSPQRTGGRKTCRIEPYCTKPSETIEFTDIQARFHAARRELGIERVILYGITSEDDHSHKHIHEDIHRTVLNLGVESCWVPALQTCSYSAESLSHALIIASPKHMWWTRDPFVERLPLVQTSYYVFHELVPARFRNAKNVAQWVVRGNDGNMSPLDGEHYALRQTFQCKSTLVCKFYKSRVMVAPWAVRYENSYPMFDQNVMSRQLHFVGTIWRVNRAEICKIAQVCSSEGIKLHVYGKQAVDLNCDIAVRSESRYVSNKERNKLLEQSPFTLAIQGAEHLNGDMSYVSDRLMTAIVTHQRVMTNNPSARLLGVPIVTNMTSGCFGTYGDSRVILSNHTYAHRIADVLSLFIGR